MTGEEDHWSMYTASQHLPAVLTDPNRGKQSNFFTKTWGDTFIEKTVIEKSPFLQEVTWSHFDAYLRKYGKRYRRHLRLSQTKIENSQSKVKHTEFNTKIIPDIYLRQNFNLNDPKVFAEVFQSKKENSR
ncbi:hypothetical protein JTB14_019170 [Gonioctena quinquepunctata]|nr:hypothetical protein JTB14_019170 [Gonioctena quinquepunctata]